MVPKYRVRNHRPNQRIHSQIRDHNRKPVFLDGKDDREFHSALRWPINYTPAAERPKLRAARAAAKRRFG